MTVYSRTSLDDIFDNCGSNNKRNRVILSNITSSRSPPPPTAENLTSTSLPTSSKATKPCPPWVKSFQCDTCSKSYNRKNSLQRHMRVHSGVKPYECGYCIKKFTRKDILEKHKESMKCQRIRLISNRTTDQLSSDGDVISSVVAYNNHNYSQ